MSGIHTSIDPKELYEHLEALGAHFGRYPLVEPAFHYVVDALLRASVHHDLRIGAEADEVTKTISRWQRTYLPTDREAARRCVCSRNYPSPSRHSAACEAEAGGRPQPAGRVR